MSKTLPAGKYYIGDPCYVISEWDAFCGIWFQQDNGGIFDYDGHDLCVFNTQYGDGSFECSDGSMLPVDAGLIAAVPLVLMTMGNDEDGVVVEFDEPFECNSDWDGTLHFGHFSVKTGDDECCPECGK